MHVVEPIDVVNKVHIGIGHLRAVHIHKEPLDAGAEDVKGAKKSVKQQYLFGILIQLYPV